MRHNRLPRLGFAFFCLALWAPLASGQPAATLAHAYCSASTAGARYFSAAFSAPFEKDPRGAEPSYYTMVTWGKAFGDYIEQKYGGPVSGQCALARSFEQAQAGVKAGMASAKRLMQNPIETDWVYKAAVPPGAAAPAVPPAASNAQTPPNVTAQGTTVRAWCSSDPNAAVIYFSQVFDTQLGRPEPGVDIFSPIATEFLQYLRGRADYKSSATRQTACGGSLSPEQASTSRSDLLASYGTGKQVVEVEWEWSPGAAEAARGVSVTQDGGYCTSAGTTGTVYTAGPFALKGRSNATYEWNRAFSQFLTGKYGFQDEVSCPVGMPQVRAQRHYSFHVQGARAGKKKVVETGWELGAAAPTTAAATPNEQKDREPARAPAPAAPPSQQARDFATNDSQEALTYCNQDRSRNGAFDCYKIRRLCL